MQCKACGGALVIRETRDHPLDENGVWGGDDETSTLDMGVYCLSCGARHVYNHLHESGGQYTLALEANSDPEPVATVALGFRGGVIDTVGADRLVGLICIDEDRREVGRFLALQTENGWWERSKKLEALIQAKEWQTHFTEKDGAVGRASAEAIRRLHEEVD